MKKFINFYKDLIFVSRITNTSKKKIRILFSVVASNLVVLLDLLIIIIFSNILEDTVVRDGFISQIISFFSTSNWLLLIVVISRFVFVYIDRMNLEVLKLNVQENLRTYFIKEVFDKAFFQQNSQYKYLECSTLLMS